MWIAPWAAVTLAHYYFVRRKDIDVPALFAPPSERRLELVRWQAVIAFLVGVFLRLVLRDGRDNSVPGLGLRALP